MRPPSVTDVLVIRMHVCLGTSIGQLGPGREGGERMKQTHSDAGAWKRMFSAWVTPTPFVFCMTPSATSGNAAQLVGKRARVSIGIASSR